MGPGTSHAAQYADRARRDSRASLREVAAVVNGSEWAYRDAMTRAWSLGLALLLWVAACGGGSVDASGTSASAGTEPLTGVDTATVTTGTDLTTGTAAPTGSVTTDTTAATTGSAASVCGDGTLDDGEVCDDGNRDNLDGCTNACTVLCADCPYMLAHSGRHRLEFDGEAWTALADSNSSTEITILSNGMGIVVGGLFGRLDYGLHYKGGIFDYQGEIGVEVSSFSLTSSGNVAHLAYRGVDDKYYYAAFDGNSWDPIAEPIGVTSNWLGSIATLGGDPVYIFRDGDNNNALSIRVRSPVWQPTEQIAPSSIGVVPRVVPLFVGAELLALDLANYSVRKAGQWSAPVFIPGTMSQPQDPPVLIALGAGRALAAWVSKAHEVHTSIYDVKSDTWTEMSVPALTFGRPALAPGIGEAEAEIVWSGTLNGTSLNHTRLINGAWTGGVQLAPFDAAWQVSAASHP